MERIVALAAAARRRANVSMAIALAIVCVLVGFATGFWLLFRVAYIVALLIPLLYFWTRSMVDSLDVEVRRTTPRVTQGQSLEGTITVRSRSPIPKIWLEVEDPSSVPGHESRRIVTLGAHGVFAWTYRTRTRVRGLYTLGPVTVTAMDPFGFFKRTRTFGHPTNILVYPNAPDLPNFYIPPANLPGEGRFRRRTQNVTPNVAGIRAYAPGDSYNRIHWPATARTGDPMVKQFELDPASDIWVVLDLDAQHHVGQAEEGTEEAAVQVAASIARFFINANRSVGMISFGDELRVDEPDRGQSQYARLMESLALARATGDVPLSNLLWEESRRFGRHTTVVVVTASTEEEWAYTLMSLQARGVKVASVLVEADTFGADVSPLGVYSTLLAGGVYTYTIKQDDDLRRVLSAGVDPGLSAGAGARG
jgi:uncharacterized protein (DUF58 family)